MESKAALIILSFSIITPIGRSIAGLTESENRYFIGFRYDFVHTVGL
ncbi:MAG: hypothetical protein IH880_05465 [Candidatus Marinimicrobia bacterium]|nr:hypothetical protein [Candidatus Neomarinimicrobiota bacterium]